MIHHYSKFKNKHIPYAKVGRRVFKSLFDAETYCTEHGLDVNLVTEYRNDPKLKSDVQVIAQYQKAILQECLNRLDKYSEELGKEIKRKNVELNNCNPLDRKFIETQRNAVVEKSFGASDAREIVNTLKYDLEVVTGWHG